MYSLKKKNAFLESFITNTLCSYPNKHTLQPRSQNEDEIVNLPSE
jgi:hypothetical protein